MTKPKRPKRMTKCINKYDEMDKLVWNTCHDKWEAYYNSLTLCKEPMCQKGKTMRVVDGKQINDIIDCPVCGGRGFC